MLAITHRKDRMLFIKNISMKPIRKFERNIKSLLKSNNLELVSFNDGGGDDGIDYYIIPTGLRWNGIPVDYYTRNMARVKTANITKEQLMGINKTDKEVSDFIKEMHKLYNSMTPSLGEIDTNKLVSERITIYVNINDGLLNGSQLNLLRYSRRVFLD